MEEISVAFSAKLRILHKRSLGWGPTRFRDAFIAWAEGNFRPGFCQHPKLGDEPVPCAYTEVYGSADNVVVVTYRGVFRGKASDLGLPVSLKAQWQLTSSATADALLLSERLQGYTIDSILTSFPFATPDVVLDNQLDTLTRYSQGFWDNLIGKVTEVPEFDTQPLCFEWMNITMQKKSSVDASLFFSFVRENENIKQWIDSPADWDMLIQVIQGFSLENLDSVDSFPSSSPAFTEWLVHTGGDNERNYKTYLGLLLRQEVKKSNLPKRVQDLIQAWESGDAVQFARICSSVKTWHSFVPYLCEFNTPSSTIRNFIWESYVDSFGKSTEIAGLSHTLAGFQENPDEKWFELVAWYVKIQSIKYTDLPSAWAKLVLNGYYTGKLQMDPKPILTFMAEEFTKRGTEALVEFSTILTRMHESFETPETLAPHVYKYACDIWPENKQKWDLLQDLDAGLVEWASMLNNKKEQDTVFKLPSDNLIDYGLI